MSKSLDNHVELAATPEETRKRVMGAVTDPHGSGSRTPGVRRCATYFRCTSSSIRTGSRT